MEHAWKNKLLGCGLAALAAGPGLQALPRPSQTPEDGCLDAM